MAAEIIHDDNIAGPQTGKEDLLDVSSEAFAVDRAVEEPWGIDAIMAQRCQERHGFPVPLWNLGLEPLAAGCPSPKRRHIGLRPCLIDEDQTLGLDPALIFSPLLTPSRDVGTVLFAGDQCFF